MITGHLEAVPVDKKEVRVVGHPFVTHVVCKHGIPVQVITDGGDKSLDDEFKRLYVYEKFP